MARFIKDLLIAARAKVSSTLMFLASMFAISESGMDQLIASYCSAADGSSIQISPLAISLCSVVWLMGLVMVVLMCFFEQFLPLLQHDWHQPEKA